MAVEEREFVSLQMVRNLAEKAITRRGTRPRGSRGPPPDAEPQPAGRGS